jgi:hypothetical protein
MKGRYGKVKGGTGLVYGGYPRKRFVTSPDVEGGGQFRDSRDRVDICNQAPNTGGSRSGRKHR